MRQRCILFAWIAVSAEGSIFNTPCAAGIFGGNRRGSDKVESGTPQQTLLPPPPPPPPGGTRVAFPRLPPPGPRPPMPDVQHGLQGSSPIDHNTAEKANTTTPNSQTDQQQQKQQPPPPPPIYPAILKPHEQQHFQQWNEMAQQQQQLDMWSNSQDGGWTNPPQTLGTMMDDGSKEQLFYLQRDLEEGFQREQALLAQLHNTTTLAGALEQREKLHIHQLDVLTERVMDIETAAAKDRNELLEYQSNCTELSLLLAEQNGEVDKWQTKCSELLELRAEDEKKIRDLKKRVRTATVEAEDLSAMIERHRLVEESGAYRKKKKVGFIAWLFGFGSNSLVDEDYEEMQETARSTLLGALRTERKSVSELEVAVATLQQNNTAIAEQVQSRDQIIDELNNRIAVFEEDKVVLKAALRQLQKEMKEESPRTNKLIDDLTDAQTQVKRLTEEMESLISSHKSEVSLLQDDVLHSKEKSKATESNLTVIGTYVDKLEERLADYTVARRDIEKREAACKKAEKKAKEVEAQRDSLKARVENLEKEHVELKKLLSELAQERASLQQENNALSTERAALKRDVLGLRQSYAQLDNEARSLKEGSTERKADDEKIRLELNATIAANQELLARLNVSESEKIQLEQHVKSVSLSQQEQRALLDEADETRRAMNSRLAELQSERETLSSRHQRFVEETQRKLDEQQRDLEAARREQQKAFEAARNATAKAISLEDEQRAAALEHEERIAAMEGEVKAAAIRNEQRAAAIESERKAAEIANEQRAAAIENERRASAIENERQSSAIEKERQAAAIMNEQKAAAIEHERKAIVMESERQIAAAAESQRKAAVIAPDRRLKEAQARREPFDLVVNPNSTADRDDNTVRPKGSPIPHVIPPYLPKPPHAPKRAFGAGLVNPKMASNATAVNATATNSPPPRKVPLRKLRKSLSKATGVHGLITPASGAPPQPRRTQPQPKREQAATDDFPLHLPKPPHTPKRAFGAGLVNPMASNAAAANETSTDTPPPRKVPLRRLRKSLSKLTGLHGLLTTPSDQPPAPKKTSPSTTPSPKKPNVIEHTLSGIKFPSAKKEKNT